MRRNVILALGLALAGTPAFAPGTRAQPAGAEAFARISDRANVTTLVNVGQLIAGASALFLIDSRRAPASLDELVAGGHVPRSRLLTTGIVRQGGAWRIVQDGASYAEIPLVATSLQAPECQEAARQAGGPGKANPPFGCHATALGVVFRFRI